MGSNDSNGGFPLDFDYGGIDVTEFYMIKLLVNS